MKMNVVDSDFELAVEHDGKSPYYFGYTFDWNDRWQKSTKIYKQ